MQVQKINQQVNKNSINPNFTGSVNNAVQILSDKGAQALRFLDTNQAIGAIAVDVGCMVIPRTLTDFSRGPSAGFETLRRESSGTLNHAAIAPVYGTLAGMLVATAINHKYDMKAQRIFADADAVEILSKIHFETKANINPKDYCEKVASSIFAKGENVNKALPKPLQEKFAKVLEQEIKQPNKENIKLLKDIILKGFGKESNLVLQTNGKQIEETADVLLKNISSLSPELFKKEVLKSFQQAKNFAEVDVVKAIKHFGTNRALLGLGIATAVGCCIQPLNIYLTKKKTGSDGFVGVDGRTKDNSKGFKLLKGGAALGFITFALSSIMNPIKAIKNPMEFVKNIQYRSLTPTMNQFKLVYGLTIASRFLAARDKDELRESAIKDTIGFSSWLILGNFVSKFTLKKLDKNLVGKTRDEVLYNAAKKLGIETVKNNKALSFMEILKQVPKNDAVRKSLRHFSIAQLAGYAFSAVVLGVGIPKLNIFMTKRSEQRRSKERAMSSSNIMLKPENLAFLNKEINFTADKMFRNK